MNDAMTGVHRPSSPGAGAGPPRTLFVNHASRLGGAEHVLLSLLASFDPASALWLFEDGPLRAEVLEQGAVRVLLPSRANRLNRIKRDKGLLAAGLPLLRDMAAMTVGIARAARGFDVLYANSQKAFVLASVAARLARKPLVWHLHDILVPAHFGTGQLHLLRLLASGTDLIIVPSEAAARALRDLGVKKAGIEVVANGLTVEPDTLPPGARKATRQAFGVPAAARLIGVFSRLSPWKGQLSVLEALALQPGLHCIMAGDALFGETEYVNTLHQAVERLGLADRVHFLGHRSDVPTLMRMVDAVVHPSLDPEPFGRTLVEAMLCETPVVATPAGAAREILADGAAGLLVEPGNPAAIAGALAHVFEDADATRRRVRHGRRRALELYGERTMRDSVLTAVRGVAAGPAG